MSKANSIEDYLSALPAERQEAMRRLRTVIKENLPKGFEECITYGMIGYVVPHSLYPKGYHVDPKLPLGFISIASQKSHIALYHMGLYGSEELLTWFKSAYAAAGVGKLDMGKSCIRFKQPNKIPFELIGDLAKKLTPKAWIAAYEAVLNR